MKKRKLDGDEGSVQEQLTAEKAAQAETSAKSKQPKDTGSGRRRVFRNGVYASAITAVVIVLAIVLNLAVGAIPTKYTKFDLSGTGIYTLSDTTKQILDGLTQDVTIYYLGQTGSEDTVVTQLLDRYAGESSHVHWEQKDPALYPTFASQYDAASASEGSLIVVSGDKHNLVDSSDIYQTDYSNYYTTGAASYTFDGENAVTTAIANVTSGASSKAYYTSNHSEAALSSSLQSAIQAQNITVSELNLLTQTIPDDCSLLIINCPQQDFSGADSATNEAGQLESYLAGGGKVLLLTDPSCSTPNLDAVMAEYGLTRTAGLVVEGDSNSCLPDSYSNALYQNGYVKEYIPSNMYLLPTLNTSGESGIADSLSGSNLYFLMPQAQAITIADVDSMPSNVTAEALLTSSEASYNDADSSTTGPFDLAVWATNSSTGAELVWINSGLFSDSELDSDVVNGSNSKLLLACAATLTGQNNQTLVEAKALESDTLTFTAAATISMSAVFLAVIPLALVIAGAVVTITRRRK